MSHFCRYTVWTLVLVAPMISLGQASRSSPVAPSNEQLETALSEAYSKYKELPGGKNADYIPYLAQIDPHLFGLAVVTVDGHVYTRGDADFSFAIESISKVFTLALVMDERGPDAVFKQVGAEPTGRPFNSILALEDLPGHTGNPFVNPGAIATTSLVKGTTEAGKWDSILGFYSKLAGTKLSLIDEVYTSEASTNTRNKAIASLLAGYGKMYADSAESTDIYTKQCSVGVSAKQLAVMGATLANNGINPITGAKVVDAANIPHILAVMMMAGLYDGSGAWAWNVGIPAKSGVGGGILAIVPGKGAIVAFAPPLDSAGNSVKAQKSIASVADALGINIFSASSVGLK